MSNYFSVNVSVLAVVFRQTHTHTHTHTHTQTHTHTHTNTHKKKQEAHIFGVVDVNWSVK